MSWVRGRLSEVQLAFMLLSRLPAGNLTAQAPDLAAARWAFPFVGLVIGAVIATAYYGLCQLGFPAIISAFLALALAVMATGALHEDGLADSADGMGGGHERERKLAIMKDSHIGSYGVLGLIFVMGTRLSGLSYLPPENDIIWPIIGCAVFSRIIMVAYLCLLPSARENGLGNMASGHGVGPLLSAFLISLPVFYLCGLTFIPALIVMAMIASLFGLLAKRQIGGQTGDICGAGQLLTETAGWLTLLVL